MQSNRVPLFEDYSIEIVLDNKLFWEFINQNKDIIFDNNSGIDLSAIQTDKEKESIKLLSNNLKELYKLKLYIFKGEKRIGWFLGTQLNFDTFFMNNTGIFAEYRNKGIYKALLPIILNILSEKGFQLVSSKHRATNNHILTLKLKAGFVITGFEVSDVWGLLINLTFYFNDKRRKLVDYRVGQIKPDEEIKKLLA
jgi:hypothetical protein